MKRIKNNENLHPPIISPPIMKGCYAHGLYIIIMLNKRQHKRELGS